METSNHSGSSLKSGDNLVEYVKSRMNNELNCSQERYDVLERKLSEITGRIEKIESQLESGFEKMSETLSELSNVLKSHDTEETLEQFTKWNQLDHLPCMCCEKNESSIDKSFFSKEEGENTLECVSSLDKETCFLLTHYSEPVLRRSLVKLRPLGTTRPSCSKSLSQLWLDRLKLSNLSHFAKK